MNYHTQIDNRKASAGQSSPGKTCTRRAPFRLLTLALVAGLFGTGIAAAQTGEIRGLVLSRDGTPLLAATVNLDEGQRTAITNTEGTFRIADIAAGSYSLSVSHISYKAFTTTITVKAGQTGYVEVVLDEQPFQAEAVTVTASRSPYRASLSSTATKTPTPLFETPMSVEIVTSERLDKQKFDRVDDAFDYMTGVVRGGATRAQGYLLRGIEVDNRFIPYQVDGISGGVWRQHEPPSAIIERIEYLKGPASVLYGITQLGGVINYITKKPQAAQAGFIELRHSTYASELSPLGSANSASVTADMTGPLADSGRLMYRFIANHMNNTSFREDVEDYSLDLLPEITWVPTHNTALTVSLNVNVDKGRWDEYLPVPDKDLSKLPDIRTRINEPQDYYWDYGYGIGYILRHNVSDSWTLRSTGRFTSRIDGRRLFQFNKMIDDSTMSRRWRDQFNQRVYSYFDVTSENSFSTGSVNHTLLSGVTLGIEDIHFERLNLQGDSTLDINIYEPVHNAAPLYPANPDYNRFWDNTVFGAYVQDQIQLIDQLHLVAGAQYLSESTVHEQRRKEVTFEKFDKGILPRVGVIVLPTEELSVYGSYSTSLSPTNAERENAEGNSDFDPELGQQLEAGLKFNLFNSRLGGSFAYYTLERKNALNPTGEKNENGNTIYLQTGITRNSGIEVDLYASPVEGLFITMGMNTNDATVIEDNDATLIGARLAYVPDITFNGWMTYRFGQGAVEGLEAGVGVTHMDERPAELAVDDNAFFLPSYTRVDGFVSWPLNDVLTLALNVNNIADERYFSGGDASRIVPGAPRTIRTTMKWKM